LLCRPRWSSHSSRCYTHTLVGRAQCVRVTTHLRNCKVLFVDRALPSARPPSAPSGQTDKLPEDVRNVRIRERTYFNSSKLGWMRRAAPIEVPPSTPIPLPNRLYPRYVNGQRMGFCAATYTMDSVRVDSPYPLTSRPAGFHSLQALPPEQLLLAHISCP
jgi:hypothetical protein